MTRKIPPGGTALPLCARCSDLHCHPMCCNRFLKITASCFGAIHRPKLYRGMVKTIPYIGGKSECGVCSAGWCINESADSPSQSPNGDSSPKGRAFVLCNDTERRRAKTISAALCTYCLPALRVERVREVAITNALCTYCSPALRVERVREVAMTNAPCTYCPPALRVERRRAKTISAAPCTH